MCLPVSEVCVELAGLGFLYKPVHNKVISGFKTLHQARALMAGLEPATERSLQISGRTQKPLCHQCPIEIAGQTLVQPNTKNKTMQPANNTECKQK
ncbi:hypothetical protein PoB_000141300 [Plakobranchus ocellatus]|uniref:Uncharacterized protein n=1 Tax=Plakobranchus ocellatus TaxID=259542 RepID=A0AAV3XXC9_9GAST|nr:hypothetical protein PoB_000141300 [Plakobranchus ocellatus]